MNALTILLGVLLIAAAVMLVILAVWHDEMKRDRNHWRKTAETRQIELEELQEKYNKLEKDPWVDLPRGHKGNKGKFAPRKKSEQNAKTEKK